MGEFALGLLVVALGGLSAWLTWTRDSRPIALWIRGWIFLFAAAVTVVLGGGAVWAESLVQLLGPFFPALVLAGALVHAGRPVPDWLIPLAFVFGVARWVCAQGGYDAIGHGIALVFEPSAMLAAAYFAFRAARQPPVSLRRHLLAPAFLALASLEAASAVVGIRGSGFTTPLLLAWAVVAPLAYGVQVGVTREGFLGRQRRVEQALSESEERFRALSDNAFDLVAEMNREGRFTYTNPRYEEWSGIPSAELIGQRGVDLVHPEDRERILAWFRNQSRSGGESLIAVRARHRSGDWRWIEVSGRPFHAAGELRIVASSRDVTERVELAERLQQAHDRLEERVKERTAQLHAAVASLEEEITERRRMEEERRHLESHMQEAQKLESLGVLAGGIAHDFNNLLAVILGNDALAMSEAKPGSRLAKQLERIRSAAKHAQALTSQMLTYSGKASLSLKPLDLSGLVEEMSDLLEASISKKCRLEIALAHGRSLVEGDPTQLRQVILNLVTNASEALGDRPGRVAVCTGLMTADAAYLADTFGSGDLAAGEYIYLEVSDPGEGIDEDTRNRIFEPFFSTKFTGRGLGLASVLGIVRGHRGAIKLATEAGVGTRFRVLLPPAAGTALPATRGDRERPAPRRGGKILVVDDDEAVREVAWEFLVRSGLDVVTAGGGREALEILRGDAGETIDAAVLDLAMPDLDGRETLLEMRRLRPQLPVVVASGFRKDASAERFPGDAITSFIRKPYDPDDLIDAVRTALSGRSTANAS